MQFYTKLLEKEEKKIAGKYVGERLPVTFLLGSSVFNLFTFWILIFPTFISVLILVLNRGN